MALEGRPLMYLGVIELAGPFTQLSGRTPERVMILPLLSLCLRLQWQWLWRMARPPRRLVPSQLLADQRTSFRARSLLAFSFEAAAAVAGVTQAPTRSNDKL